MSPAPHAEQRIKEALGRANGPICDDCLERQASLKYRQQANTIGRKLLEEGAIGRANDHCAYCGKTKTVSWSINERPQVRVQELAVPPSLQALAPQASSLASPRSSVVRSVSQAEEIDLLPSWRACWETVVEADGTPYRFPALPSRQMRHAYSGPAIYRWVPFRTENGDLGQLYVGEAQSLISRIGNYRTGGPGQQTSYRLRNLFEGFVAEGIGIRLEQLKFPPLTLGSVTWAEADLQDKLFRRFLEHMMASYYRKLGWALINA